ncbi:MAG: hypothetical protein ACLFMX_03880 [Halobacteriales archaeon]
MVRVGAAPTPTSPGTPEARAMVEIPDGDPPPGAGPAFWALVLVFNVAVLATGVGVIVLYFERDLTIAGPALAVAVAAWGVGLGGYRWARRHLLPAEPE